MTINEYQEAALTTAVYPEQFRVIYPALGMNGEAGEVADKVKKVIRDTAFLTDAEGAIILPHDKRIELAKEIGDVLWYCAILANDLGLKLDIVPCPVIRERSGLAMSSRNTLLTDEERTLAANIYRVLEESKSIKAGVKETHDYVVESINAIQGLEVQYYSIVDGCTLAEIESWDDAESVVGCITVFCGSQPIRLIDHIRYK